MAVQAQYPSHVLFLNRKEQERKNMEFPMQGQGFLDQSTPVFFSPPSNGGNNPSRKRGRETAATNMPLSHQPINLFSLQTPSHPSAPPTTLIDLSLLHTQPHPTTFVSTGLRLSTEEDHHHQQQQQQIQSNPLLSSSTSSSLIPSFLTKEIAAQIKNQKDEIDRFLQAQGEQLRRTVVDTRQRQYRELLGAAEEAAARRLREKEAEVERAAQRNAELEERIARLRAETAAWQAKARTEEAAAAALQEQLRRVAAAAAQRDEAAAAGCCSGGGTAEQGCAAAVDDAESAHVDPERTSRVAAAVCRACGRREVGAVVLPCRHLCVCRDCGHGINVCPVCLCVRSACVEVFLSPSSS